MSLNFQQIIFALNQYWADQGCVILQPYDMEVGAGTFHPATFLASIGPEPSKAAYVQPSRRPADGRYGENPNRLQHYFQYQVILKPSPTDFQDLYLDSIRELGIDPSKDDIRFVEDDWEAPTLGAWGLGWEVWLNGMEITQFTYFQQAGGLECRPVTGEITYGLERIAMYVQGVDNLFHLDWNDEWSYGDLYLQNETEQSAYNFDYADTKVLFQQFDSLESQCESLSESRLPLPAYERVLQASHTFNLLDARRVIGVTERARYIARVRNMARLVAQTYYDSRERKGFPRRANEFADATPSSVAEPTARESSDNLEAMPLLLELGTEELPPASVGDFGPVLLDELMRELNSAGLIERTSPNEHDRWYATPRRVAVAINDVKMRAADEEIVRRGPPISRAFDSNGVPTPAATGFARSCGFAVEDLERIETDKGEFLAHRKTKAGQSADMLIPQCVEKAVARLPIPKRMRWGDGDTEFIRPVHWVVLLHGGDVVPCEILSVATGSVTKGHRFHCSEDLSVSGAAEYCEALRSDGYVLADWQERKQNIEQQISDVSNTVHGQIKFDESDLFNAAGLVDEVTNLVEYPSAFLGEFDSAFLELPKEVLVVSMRVHQKFFPLWKDGMLLPRFIGVANIDLSNAEVRERVTNGNERVLRARLSDARFFWEQDRKKSLEDRVEQLRGVVFHRSLGTLFEKTSRICDLSELISEMLGANTAAARRAALLSKTDLVSEMVGEFPQLQGIVGRYYALEDEESEEVANAIEEHYYPRTAGDSKMPGSQTGRIVALADRIDSLVGLIAAGEIVKGDRDPYSLRRMAAGIVRILIESNFDLDALELLRKSAETYRKTSSENAQLAGKFNEETVAGVFDLMFDRLRFYYLDRGYSADEFGAVYALKPTRPLEFDKRILAVRKFKQLHECDELIAANKRIRNILRKNEDSVDGSVNREMLAENAELSLFEHSTCLRDRIAPMIEGSDHAKALQELASLKEPIDRFFDDVMVMDENPDIRKNRLNLVSYVSHLFLEVADVSLLQVKQDDR